MVAKAPPKNSGRSWVRRISLVTTPRLPPPPPLMPQNSSGSRHLLTRRSVPSAVTISASSTLPAAVPQRFRERAEAAALHMAGHPHRGAAAALGVAPALGGHRVIDVDPHRAGLDRDRRDRRHLSLAPRRYEGFDHLHLAHRPGPDQQRIRRGRRA